MDRSLYCSYGTVVLVEQYEVLRRVLRSTVGGVLPENISVCLSVFLFVVFFVCVFYGGYVALYVV